MSMPRIIVALATLAVLLPGCSRETPAPQPEPPSVAESEVPSGPLVVQASRPPQMMIPVLDGWRSETGGQFELALEDDEEPAQPDLIIYASVADVWDAAEADELRPVFSDTVSANIDSRLRDGESRWVGLSKRGRVVVYNPELVSPEEIAGVEHYESLRDEHWQGRLCLSSSAVGGNRLLVALLISRHDLREAELVVRGWRANFAAGVLADDDALLDQAIAEAISRKPKGHDFVIDRRRRRPAVSRHMSVTGG